MQKQTLVPALFTCVLLCGSPAPSSAAHAGKTTHGPTVKHRTVQEEAVWHLHEGERLLKLRQDAAALVHLNEALRLQPDNVQVLQAMGTWHFHEGERLIKQGQDDDAIEQWDEALRLQPKNAQIQKEALALRKTRSLWRYNEGERLQKLGQTGDAIVQWEAAVRLQPDNLPAQQELKTFKDKMTAEAIAGVKKALAQFGNAATFSELNEVLTDKSAMLFAAEILFQEREAAQDLQFKPPAALNASIADDFEGFMHSYKLFGAMAQHSVLGMRDLHQSEYPTPGLQGRRLMVELIHWAKRLHRSLVDVTMIRPRRINLLKDHLDQFQYMVHDGGWVDIDGTDLDDQVPLEARFEDGKWRIGAREGWEFHYPISTSNHRYNVPGLPITEN